MGPYRLCFGKPWGPGGRNLCTIFDNDNYSSKVTHSSTRVEDHSSSFVSSKCRVGFLDRHFSETDFPVRQVSRRCVDVGP